MYYLNSLLLIFLLIILISTKSHIHETISLRHQSSKTQQHNNILGTCDKVNGITDSVTGITGTWNGNDCDSKCTAVKGTVCGKFMKDCCAMNCEGSFIKSCKFGLKITKKQMGC